MGVVIEGVWPSQGREGGVSGDPTLVALIPGHHDVTIHPPVLAPTTYNTSQQHCHNSNYTQHITTTLPQLQLHTTHHNNTATTPTTYNTSQQHYHNSNYTQHITTTLPQLQLHATHHNNTATTPTTRNTSQQHYHNSRLYSANGSQCTMCNTHT